MPPKTLSQLPQESCDGASLNCGSNSSKELRKKYAFVTKWPNNQDPSVECLI